MPDTERHTISLEDQARVENQPLASTQAEAQLFEIIDRTMGVEPQNSAQTEYIEQVGYIRELNALESELVSVPQEQVELRRQLEARRNELRTNLEVMVRTEKDKERYVDVSLRLFTRLQTQKETALLTVKTFTGLRPNANEIMGPINGFRDRIESLRKEGDPGSQERKDAELKAAALEYEFSKVRAEVEEAIKNYNPVRSLRLNALTELELAEDQRVARDNPQIRELLKILNDPELSQRFGKEVEDFRDEYNALVRIHNFAVAGRGKGAVEITTALGELDQAALVELFGADELRQDIIGAYIVDRNVFSRLDGLILNQDEAEAVLEETTVLGNNKRTFVRTSVPDPNNPDREIDLETLYRTTSSEAEKKALIDRYADKLTGGYKTKKAWEKKYVDDVLSAEFFTEEQKSDFRRREGIDESVADAGLIAMIEASYEYKSRKIILGQHLDNMVGFLETTVAPMAIKPIKVKTLEPLKNGGTEAYIFAGKYKDNPLVKARYPQDVLESGGKVNSRIIDITNPIFDKGFYKYTDPGFKLMTEIFKMEEPTVDQGQDKVVAWLDGFKSADVLSRIRENPEIVNKLKDDVYKDAVTVQSSEMYDKFEAFQREPSEESAKALMASYFSKTPEDRRSFNMDVIEALLKYKMKINGIYAFKDFNERGNWGARRAEDYIKKAREAGLIGLREENELMRRIFTGASLPIGFGRRIQITPGGRFGKEVFSKPLEFAGAYTKEVFGIKNIMSTGKSWLKTLFNESVSQIKSDLK